MSDNATEQDLDTAWTMDNIATSLRDITSLLNDIAVSLRKVADR
jgi:hypothetical protein